MASYTQKSRHSPTTWTYTSYGLVDTVDGPRTDVSDITDYDYISAGNMVKITNPLGQITEITSHDAHGNPLTIVDPNGVTTTLTYDARQRLKTRTVDGVTTGFDYDGVGQIDKVTLPGGAYLDYTYDAAHRLTDIQDNLGNRIHYTLDALGNRTKEELFDPSNAVKRLQSQVFNELGRLHQMKNAGVSVVSEYGYDAQGNRVSQTDFSAPGRGFTTSFTPDALNRTRQVTDAANGVTQYGYNALNQLESVTDPKNLTTSYMLNALGDTTQQSSPDTGSTSYTHDSGGNRKTQTDARGVTAIYSYDVLNRVTAVDYPGTAEDVNYSWDGANYTAGILNGVGRLTGITDESGSATILYDTRGNVVEERRVIGGSTHTTGYGYDSANRLTSISYPTGRVVSYQRNAIGQVSKVITTVDSVTTTIADSISYLPFGGIKSYTLGNGITVTRSHDQDYQLEEIKDQGSATVQNLKFQYDLRHNLESIEDLVSASKSQTFSYDNLSRLSSADGAYGLQGFTYDSVGNRLSSSVTPPGGSTSTDTYTYPATSHRLSTISGPNPASFSYDDAGAITGKGGLSLSYNNAHRPTIVTGSATMGAVFNASGQRVQKSVDGVTSTFHYDRSGHLLAETRDSGLLIQREYLWLDDLPLAQASERTIPDYIVDNTDTGFSTAGAWSMASASGQFGSSYAYRTAASEVPGQTVADDFGAVATDASSTDAPSPVLVPASSTMYAPPTDQDGTFSVNWSTPTPTLNSIVNIAIYRYELHGYELQMAGNSAFAGQSVLYTGPAQTFQLNQIPSGDYWFRVRAVWKRCIKKYDTCDLNGQDGAALETTAWFTSTNNRTNVNSGCAINNSDACAGSTSYTGTWTARTADPSCSTDECRPYPETAGATYHRSESNLVGTDLPRFTWSLHTPGPGRYRVYAHWPVVAGAGLANFSISHQGGVAVVSVNQSASSGAWQSMGSYDFDTNTSISLSPAPGSVVIADAVKLVPVEDITNDIATWVATGEGGEYKLYARWPAVGGVSSSAPFTINDSSGSTNLTTDQTTNTATWNLFGTFTFDDPTTQGIKLNAVWDKKVIADAMHFVPVAANSHRHHLAYFHVDQLNTPQKMTDASQAVVWDASYEPFGKASISSQPHYDNPLRFPGQYFDAETGLHQNWWRDYDPTLGRYLQSDPLGLYAGLNTYAYVGSNPINYADPMGLRRLPGDISDDAKNDAHSRFSRNTWHNGPGDAYRHCLASCMLTQENSEAEATFFGWANEKRGDWTHKQEEGERQMDDANNAAGRACGKTAKSKPDCVKGCLNAPLTQSYQSGSTPPYQY